MILHRARTLVAGATALTLCVPARLVAQTTEYVTIQKVTNDSAIVVRRNGSTYLIEKGVGCLSLWRYEGKQALVSSPGLFVGVGSKLILSDVNQECPIWDSKEIVSGSPSTAPAQSERLRGTDQLSFYDSQGHAAAYIDASSELTFYLWSGEPVAYLDDDSVYGFNGKHLGWFQNGMVYDNSGDVVVAPATAFRSAVEAAPPRSAKQFQPFKSFKEFKPFKPFFGTTWARTPARAFFLLGTQ